MIVLGKCRFILSTMTGLALSSIVVAQRSDENAVTAAQDAFGTSIGFQNVGLYSPNDARGFSPQQAGNLRIEGLYFDQQTWTTSDCMVRETTMRVGVAAQSYSFPAPTGIADVSLRTPGDKSVFSAVLTRGPFNTATADVETQFPLIDRVLNLDVCAGYRKNFEVDMFHASHTAIFGTTFRWRPTATTEVIPFWSFIGGGARQIVPGVYTDGTLPLPLFRAKDLGTQNWATWGWHQTTFGAVAKSTLGDHWEFAGGLFRSLERDPLGYQPYLTLQADHTADSVMDVVPPFDAASTSGELRLTRLFISGAHRQKLEFTVRGRSVERVFGGDAIADFGSIDLNSQASFAQPAWTFTPQSRDSTREIDFGVTVEEHWQGVGSFAVGALSDHYRRQVRAPPTTVDADQTHPVLLNLRAETDRIHGLIYYASFVQGLEDSALAPVSANNRNEPPPATRTWQMDGGLRWAPTEKVQLILGAFDIHKPYFNSDAANVYTQLGRVEHRGLETSLSFNDSGFTLLIGGVYLRPRVPRDIAEPGATGNVPLGPVPLTWTANIDFAPPAWGPWAASLQWNRLSTRVATTDDAMYLPALATLGAGLRYHWTQLAHPWTLRVDGYNLTDSRGLHVSDLEVVLPEQGRRFALTVATDF
jgi:iron complex outermembrane recepter protein